MATGIMTTAARSGAGFQALLDATRDVYAAEIFFTALPVMKFDQFSTKRTELEVQPGKQILIPKYGNIKRGGKLTEGTPITTRAMSMSMQPITVDEQGNAIGFSERLLQQSFFDQMQAASILLGRDMAVVLDTQLRDTVLSASSIVRGDATVPGVEASTRGTTVAGFDTRCIKDCVETLETQNAPRWDNDFYVSFVHPHQARALRDDPEWINASLYARDGKIFNGEIGRFEDVRFVSTTMMTNGSNSAIDPDTGEYVNLGYKPELDGVGANSASIFQACVFGEFAYGHATALPVELRDNGITDFGREHALAWYAIWGTGILLNQNIVLVETT